MPSRFLLVGGVLLIFMVLQNPDGVTGDFYRRFHKRAPLRALDGVSLEVRDGELVGLIGPNGAVGRDPRVIAAYLGNGADGAAGHDAAAGSAGGQNREKVLICRTPRCTCRPPRHLRRRGRPGDSPVR